jgi:hypothetical protein
MEFCHFQSRVSRWFGRPLCIRFDKRQIARNGVCEEEILSGIMGIALVLKCDISFRHIRIVEECSGVLDVVFVWKLRVRRGLLINDELTVFRCSTSVMQISSISVRVCSVFGFWRITICRSDASRPQTFDFIETVTTASLLWCCGAALLWEAVEGKQSGVRIPAKSESFEKSFLTKESCSWVLTMLCKFSLRIEALSNILTQIVNHLKPRSPFNIPCSLSRVWRIKVS